MLSLDWQREIVAVVDSNHFASAEAVAERCVSLVVSPLQRLPQLAQSLLHLVENGARHSRAVNIVEVLACWIWTCEANILEDEGNEIVDVKSPAVNFSKLAKTWRILEIHCVVVVVGSWPVVVKM